jgi:hypothetical protein
MTVTAIAIAMPRKKRRSLATTLLRIGLAMSGVAIMPPPRVDA